MCGRFVFAIPLSELSGLLRASGLEVDSIDSSSTEYPTSYNFAPHQQVPVYYVITTGEPEEEQTFEHKVTYMTWSLDHGFGARSNVDSRQFATFNARIEKVEESKGIWHRFLGKPGKAAYPRHRCIVLAQGYYEWQAKQLFETKKSTVKIPFFVTPQVEGKRDSDGAEVPEAQKTEVKEESTGVKEESTEESTEVKEESTKPKNEPENNQEPDENKKKLDQETEPKTETEHPVKPLLFFAGFCNNNTVTVITRPASPSLEWLHDREPVMLTADNASAWLKGNNEVLHSATPPLEVYRVGRAVGKVSEQGEELCRRLTKKEIKQNDEEDRITAMPKRMRKEEHPSGKKNIKLSSFFKSKGK